LRKKIILLIISTSNKIIFYNGVKLMTKISPIDLKDWQIAREYEKNMRSIDDISSELGILKDEVLPYGRNLAKIDYQKVLARTGGTKRAKYINVSGITPTPLGEGKTTSAIGLLQGLGYIGKKATAAIRQPSGGPTFNIKGSAAGGGLAQCIPMAPFSLGMTGDIDAITNAHNLAMVALTSRMQHEFNYDDETLAKRNLKRLDIDPERVELHWVMDFCAQSLRNITIGKGGKMDGLEMESGFNISVSSELMTILALSNNLKEMRERISKIIVAYSKSGKPVTTADIEVDGAMCALMVNTLNPSLIQSLEGQPVFVHAGPFANISIGQSSVIADKLAVSLADYHITESGFGADIGYEKFWNLKCRYSGLTPDAGVVIATVRALKSHGGGPEIRATGKLDEAYTTSRPDLVENGCENLVAHIDTIKKSGIRPVVCINAFYTDSDDEINVIKKAAEANGAYVAKSDHWLKGGEGAVELAEAVIAAADEPNNFKCLYETSASTLEKIELIAKEVYGADDVSYTDKAKNKLDIISKDESLANSSICVAKTQMSISHDPALKGRPTGWTLPVQDILIYAGAELIVPVTGSIKLMPGTGSNPAFRGIDVNTDTGEVTGMF
jgi:formyltetrahydrofolate synthetase